MTSTTKSLLLYALPHLELLHLHDPGPTVEAPSGNSIADLDYQLWRHGDKHDLLRCRISDKRLLKRRVAAHSGDGVRRPLRRMMHSALL